MILGIFRPISIEDNYIDIVLTVFLWWFAWFGLFILPLFYVLTFFAHYSLSEFLLWRHKFCPRKLEPIFSGNA